MQYEEIKKYIGKNFYYIDKEDKKFPIKEVGVGKAYSPLFSGNPPAIIGPDVYIVIDERLVCDLFKSFNEAKFEYFRRAFCDKNIGRVGCCVVDGLRLETDCFIECMDSRADGTGFIDAVVTVSSPAYSVWKENIENVFPTKEMAQEYINNSVKFTKKRTDISETKVWKETTLEPIDSETIKTLKSGDMIFWVSPYLTDRVVVFKYPNVPNEVLKNSLSYWNLNAAQFALENIQYKNKISKCKMSNKRISKEDACLLKNGDVYYYFNDLGEVLSKTFCDSKGLNSPTDERILTIDGGYWNREAALVAVIEAIRKGRIN